MLIVHFECESYFIAYLEMYWSLLNGIYCIMYTVHIIVIIITSKYGAAPSNSTVIGTS